MTKEELLSHHIMIPNHFRKEELLLYCRNGYKLLYKIRCSDKFILVIISDRPTPFTNYKTKLKHRYKCIIDDSYSILKYLDGRPDSLLTYMNSSYTSYVWHFTVYYENLI